MVATNSDLSEFKNYLKIDYHFSDKFNCKVECQIDNKWMLASFKNALTIIKDSEINVDGFRAGKAPKELLNNAKKELALKTTIDWILNDITRILRENDNIEILSNVDFIINKKWVEGEDFIFEGNLKCWELPDIDIDCLVQSVNQNLKSKNILLDDSTVSFDLLQSIITELLNPLLPSPIEELVVNSHLAKLTLDNNLGDESKYDFLKQGLSLSLLIKKLNAHVSDTELNESLSNLAISQNLSFEDLYSDLVETQELEVYRQHLEVEKALIMVSERIN
jgi:FKBP-type peptidyl-prolyl cis-trans isomerase (trigger factor)